MAVRWVRLDRPLCTVWTRKVRFSGVGALGCSVSARRLGGLTGRQLTGPVAEAPEVNMRRSARLDHETELAARSPGRAGASCSFFFVGGSSRTKKCITKKKTFLVRGCTPLVTGILAGLRLAARRPSPLWIAGSSSKEGGALYKFEAPVVEITMPLCS